MKKEEEERHTKPLLHLLNYAEAYNELTSPISAP